MGTGGTMASTAGSRLRRGLRVASCSALGVVSVWALSVSSGMVLGAAANTPLQVTATPSLLPNGFSTSIHNYVTRCTTNTPNSVGLKIAIPSNTTVQVDGQAAQKGPKTLI